MDRRDFVSLVLASVVRPSRAQGLAEIVVVISPKATELEALAARELSKYLQILFPQNSFPIGIQLPARGASIQLGTVESFPELRRYASKGELAAADGFVVTHTQAEGASLGIILGADARGTLYAVYALLERLGCGFYLSYEVHPAPRPGPFTLDEWELADAPLTLERIVLNWHNFLSGCSAWNLSDWQRWISQLAKMRFTSIMVHAYGNNPMFSFTHNGQRKPTSYLTTSVRGRDWGTEHVNDVRRLIGGEGVFSRPVFGADAGLVAEDECVAATTELMKQVFAFARSRGLGVSFAVDVDTITTNPQNVIATLPEAATFWKQGLRLPNPDTPEGFAYYQSQVRQLLETYPQIDQIVVWFRDDGSPWRDLRPRDFPIPWKREYEQALKARPALGTDKQAPSLFAICKIVAAFQKALSESGSHGVQLAIGSWTFTFVAAADAFLSPDVKVICIDQYNVVANRETLPIIRAVSSHRKLIPIPYAQDDDHGYAGRPYTPFTNLASSLEQSGSAGYGILHWTTRPLDLYFRSLATQVWRQTRDQPLSETCAQMALRTFGESGQALAARYLLGWIADAPMFGIESTDRFIERPLKDVEGEIAGCKERLQILESLARLQLSAEGLKQLAYFREWERFVMAFYDAQSAWQSSVEFLKRGDVAGAKQALAACRPEQVLKQYARAASALDITPGELGLLISMNLHWLPYIVSQRQALGLEPVRVKFMPTRHDPLAQSPGRYTFFFDQDGALWLGWGEKETGIPVSTRPAKEELFASGLRLGGPVSLKLRTMMGHSLLPGAYGVKLLFSALSAAAEASVVDVTLYGSENGKPSTGRVRISSSPERTSELVPASLGLQVTREYVQLEVSPVEGEALLCGVILDRGAS